MTSVMPQKPQRQLVFRYTTTAPDAWATFAFPMDRALRHFQTVQNMFMDVPVSVNDEATPTDTTSEDDLLLEIDVSVEILEALACYCDLLEKSLAAEQTSKDSKSATTTSATDKPVDQKQNTSIRSSPSGEISQSKAKQTEEVEYVGWSSDDTDAEYHADTSKAKTAPTNAATLTHGTLAADWKRVFVQQYDMSLLQDLFYVVSYLDFASLHEVIRDKLIEFLGEASLEEIRTVLGEMDDLTREDKENIAAAGAYCVKVL